MATLFRNAVIAVLAVGLVRAATAAAQAPETKPAFSDAAVEAAIDKGKAYLYSLYQEQAGRWPEGTAVADAGIPDGVNFSGRTALAVYALLATGESPQDPRLKQAIEWLRKQEPRGTYALAVRCQVWALLADKDRLAKESRLLMESVCRPKAGFPAITLPAAEKDPAAASHPAGEHPAAPAPPKDPAWDAYGTYTYLSEGKPGPGGAPRAFFPVACGHRFANISLESPTL